MSTSACKKRKDVSMACPVLVHFKSDGSFWLHGLGSRSVTHLSREAFERLSIGKTTNKEEGVQAGCWCLVGVQDQDKDANGQ